MRCLLCGLLGAFLVAGAAWAVDKQLLDNLLKELKDEKAEKRIGAARELGKLGPSLEFRQRARIVREIAEAIQHAHALGIQHRDLKPSNIMLVSDASKVLPKVLDFGTARQSLDSLMASGASMGPGCTPLYASPEQ